VFVSHDLGFSVTLKGESNGSSKQSKETECFLRTTADGLCAAQRPQKQTQQPNAKSRSHRSQSQAKKHSHAKHTRKP
jgi:hypothetical protein